MEYSRTSACDRTYPENEIPEKKDSFMSIRITVNKKIIVPVLLALLTILYVYWHIEGSEYRSLELSIVFMGGMGLSGLISLILLLVYLFRHKCSLFLTIYITALLSGGLAAASFPVVSGDIPISTFLGFIIPGLLLISAMLFVMILPNLRKPSRKG